MLPSAHRIIGHHFFFLEDNEPKHGGPRRSKKRRAWIMRNKDRRMPFPSQSSDLNPIEHVWKRLKIKVNERDLRIIKELKKFIKKEFFQLHRRFTSNLVYSMPARLRAIIKARGGYTKY